MIEKKQNPRKKLGEQMAKGAELDAVIRAKLGGLGYAVGFEKLVDFVHSSAPGNHFVEQALRDEVKMFPRQAIRELIANALVHQSFEATGQSVMVEMYNDRLGTRRWPT